MPDESPGPLSRLLIENADVIDAAIEDIGPSAVAEFFVNFGTGMAAAYDLANINEPVASPSPAGEDAT